MPETQTRKRSWKRGALFSLSLLICGFALFYWYQPWEVDVFPRKAPVLPIIDPESALLFRPGTKVLIVTAHPDDSEFYLAGLLDKLGNTGAKTKLVLATDGDKDYYPFGDSATLRKIRRREQIDAAKDWGCDDVVFLALPDGRLRTGDPLQERVRAEIERFDPAYVLSFDPLYHPRISHADHRRCGESVEQALKALRKPIWHMRFQTESPNWYFDISDTWNRRLKLLGHHKSQWPRGPSGDFGVVNGIIESFSRKFGERIGVQYAEGFRCTKYSSINIDND